LRIRQSSIVFNPPHHALRRISIDRMGRVHWHHAPNKPVDVDRSAEDVLNFLMNVEACGKCYPGAETVKKVGENEYEWHMTERNVSNIKMAPVQRCKYARKGNVISWEPVHTDATNMDCTGKFTIEAKSPKQCSVQVEVDVETEIKIPRLLMPFAQKLGERETVNTWKSYVTALKSSIESGKITAGEMVFDDADALGELGRKRHDPAAREKEYLEVVNGYYDAVTDLYQTGWGSHFHFGVFYDMIEPAEVAIKRLETMIIKAGNITSDCYVLDVGCGVGGPTCNIAQVTGCKIVGLNINANQVDRARERAKDLGVSDLATFDVADAMKMPYPDCTFDVITFFESVCHMPSKADFFKECYRVLKPGGRISASDWMQCDNPAEEERRRYIEPICAAHAVPHMGSVQSYKRDMENAGFFVSTAIDLRAEGDILRNWEMLDQAMIKSFHERPVELYDKEKDPLMDMLLTGGVALSEGAKGGVFILGRFLAHKPTVEGRWDPPAKYGRFPQAGLGVNYVPMIGKSTVTLDKNLENVEIPVIADVMAPHAKLPEESKKRTAEEAGLTNGNASKH